MWLKSLPMYLGFALMAISISACVFNIIVMSLNGWDNYDFMEIRPNTYMTSYLFMTWGIYLGFPTASLGIILKTGGFDRRD